MQQISTERVQGETRLGRQGDPLENVQEISIRPYKQMVYAQLGASPRKMTHINSYGTLTYKRDHLINKRKRIWKIVNFAVPADHRINLKEGEKKVHRPC